MHRAIQRKTTMYVLAPNGGQILQADNTISFYPHLGSALV
jgi:hypothetical protein